MKSFIISTTLLLATLQSVSTLPTAEAPAKRWFRSGDRIAAQAHNIKTLPPATKPCLTPQSHGKDPKNDDPISEYLVVMTEDEKRAWPVIFDEMGYNATRVKETRDVHKFLAFDEQLGDSSYISFQTEEGTRIETFGKSIRAFTMKMRESDAEGMADMENVGSLEKNGLVYASVMPQDEEDLAAEAAYNLTSWDEEHIFEKRQNGRIQTQNTAPWNLQRVSSANRVNAQGRRATDLNYSYRFDQSGGAGVDVYVLDTGINTAHTEFGGRASMGFTGYGNNFNDDGGHGSHCSGTIGGTRFGVSKNVNLIGAKVLPGRGPGTFAAILGGLEFAYRRHLQRMKDPNFKGSVVSMSLGGNGRATGALRAMEKCIQAGMHFSVAAGNDNADACSFWPAGFSAQIPIITVGATDINDNRARFSNFGRCVDIHAPGVAIISSHNRGPQSITSMQGTSMACPAVSGMIAEELVKNPNLKLNPKGMKQLILSKAIRGVVRGTNNAPNMLNNGLR
ncbi:serine protease [Arthrobotrys conoides]|uniref:Serine protease n=1 Tax=Arthrobotrys conoides TaxID=74498 RepID=A0AAN8RWB3_9PEZI